MYGAIIGDLAGSIYEYEQTKRIKNISINNIIEDNAFYSDDTILTIAIMDAINNDRDYEKYLKYYINKYRDYRPNYEPYFETSFSPGILRWADGNSKGTSTGNGAMMRISPIGYMFNTENEVLMNAFLATKVSHDSVEAIYSATVVALVIFYLRKGLSLDEVYKRINVKLKFEEFQKFNTTCYQTLYNCLYTLYYSNSFEDAIRKTIYMGGDTDTNACIVGSMAGALYNIDDDLIDKANSKLPIDFIKVLNYKK